MAAIDINNIPGRALHRAFFSDHVNPARDVSMRGKVPGRKLMPNYWVTLPGGERWLVLYFYGNDELPDKLARRLIGEENYTLAVRELDGLLAFASAEVRKYRGKNQTYLNLMSVLDGPPGAGPDNQSIRLPRAYRKRIGQLLRKRPYEVGVCAHALLAFLDHEASYSNLQQHLTYSFRFDRARLTYRCGRWWVERALS